jgi:hypothetical protein
LLCSREGRDAASIRRQREGEIFNRFVIFKNAPFRLSFFTFFSNAPFRTPGVPRGVTSMRRRVSWWRVTEECRGQLRLGGGA